MGKTKAPVSEENKGVSIKSLNDLVALNLETLGQVVTGDIDNRKAQLIFTGSRTITSSLKVGIEAMKLGLAKVSGIPIGDTRDLLPTPRDKKID